MRVEGASDEAAVEIGGLYYVLPDSVIAKYLRKWLERMYEAHEQSIVVLKLVMCDIVTSAMGSRDIRYRYGYEIHVDDPSWRYRREEGLTGEEVIRHFEARGIGALPSECDAAECGALLSRRNTRVFSPSAWRRSEDL